MKSIRILTFAITALIISSCVNGQFRKTVYGNGHVVTREREAKPFTEIKASSGIDVIIRQGNSESITVEADENLQEYIKTEINGGELNVYTEADIRRADKEKVYVTMKEIKSVRTTSAGDISAETAIKTDKLELSASSAGNIKLEVYAKEINVDISSSGDITLKGDADRLDANLSSAGDLKAFDLKVKEADISVSSAGDADINVSDKITARASSAGDINYMGDPKYVDAHASSAGGIHKR